MSKKVSSVNAEKNKKILLDLLKEPGNKNCSECNARGPLCWASVNLGVFFCTRCAGVHRGIGVHITFVKGVNLDVWEDKHLEMLIKMGNEKSNAYYEAGLPPSKKPTESSSAREVEEFLRNKYEKKKWVVRNNDRNDDDQYERRKNPTQSPRNNHREVAPSPPRREQPRKSSNGHREEQRRQPQKQSLFEDEEEFTPQARSQGSSNASSVSSFAQLSNRTSKPSQPPQQQQKMSQSNNLFEFDEPAKPQQNSTSIDDMFEGVFSNQNQPTQKGGQQQQHVQSTHQPKSANILNLFDQPQNPTMVPQRQQGYPQTFSPQFPNQQFQQHPQQFQQHYGHPHHMQQMHHMQQQHYPQQQFQQHQQYPQGGFSPQYPNQQFQQHPQGFGGQQPQYQQQQQQYQQRRGF